MPQDSDSQPRQRNFAVPSEKLREFHDRCLAVANAGSEIFLLLGDERVRGAQRFEIVRVFDSGELGRIEEPVAEYRSTWRGPALKVFKAALDMKPGGYAGIAFLRYEDMRPRTDDSAPDRT